MNKKSGYDNLSAIIFVLIDAIFAEWDNNTNTNKAVEILPFRHNTSLSKRFREACYRMLLLC